MTDLSKIQPVHRQRAACVYIRQSTPHQMEHHRESTARQYALVERARELGWAREQIHVIDEDLGVSGAGDVERAGFARLAAEVALGHVGLVLGLEVSRLARNNADWYRLLDLCGMTDTLIGDDDGLYHPGLFNDRLLLGLKGTMSEAERHIIRARLDGGIRNKAARGELRRGLPVGFVWGEADGEVLFHPDAAVCGAIRAVFERFAEFGSARRVWLWFRSEGLDFPLQSITLAEIRWVAASYHAIHQVLTNPVYAGAYAYGKSRHERYVDDQGNIRKRVRKLPREQWAVLIREHHPGYIDWETYEANQTRLAQNTRPRPHQGGGAVREGSALLQGLATCGHCGRRLRTHYRGNNATPGYHCAGKQIVDGRGCYCLNVGGVQIDAAVAKAFLEALTPAGIEAVVLAAEQREADRDAALAQWRLAVERARYEAERSRAALPPGRAGEPPGRSRLGEGVGAAPARARRGRGRACPTRATAPAHPRPRGASTPRRPRDRPGAGVVGGEHHGPRPQGVAAHAARGGHHPGRTRRGQGRADPALARRPDHRACHRSAALQPATDPHRGGHHRPGAPPGGALSRCDHCRDPQPPGPQDSHGTALHRRQGSAISVATGRSRVFNRPASRRRPRWSTSRRRRKSLGSHPLPCIAGSTTASSPASRSHRAHPGVSVSPRSSRPALSRRHRRAICPCSRRPNAWGSPVRR